MERVRVLIQKLVEQERAGAGPAQLLQTVQELHAALGAQQQQAALPAGGRVAVMMPALAAATAPAAAQEGPPPAPEPAAVPEPEVPAPPVEAPPPAPAAPVEEPQPAPPPAPEPYVQQQPEAPPPPAYVPPAYEAPPAYTPPPVPAYTPPPTPPPPAYATPPFNPMEEVPTLAQQNGAKELHKSLGESPSSLNDKLKQEHVELGKKLTGGPIKDLRKGIGINDRYLFISELFRGDEAMYERSIKTINGFHILPEAEYWINRELKLKLGWPDASETVQHFDQLVRRRFS